MISMVGYGEPAGAISVPGAAPGAVGFPMRVLLFLLARKLSLLMDLVHYLSAGTGLARPRASAAGEIDTNPAIGACCRLPVEDRACRAGWSWQASAM
jgi:hypothetical protein